MPVILLFIVNKTTIYTTYIFYYVKKNSKNETKNVYQYVIYLL